MIRTIFDETAQVLLRIAHKIRLTYNEVNIIVYYMLVPLTWFVMLDFILHCRPLLSVLWTLACLSVVWGHRHDFSRWCDYIFAKSVDFLLWFRRFGWDYYKASVIICVAVPIIVYIVLVILLVV